MKQIARVSIEPGSDPITIWQVAQNPARWKGHTFYPLVGKRPMHARLSVTTPHFYYAAQGDQTGGGGGGGEGIVHELCKLVIVERCGLLLRLGNREVDLVFSTVEDEVPFTDVRSGTTYWIDLVASIDSPAEIVQNWNGRVGIEIWVTHKTEEEKRWALRHVKFASIEIKILKDFTLPRPESLTLADIQRLKSRLHGYFRQRRYANYICNPQFERERAEAEAARRQARASLPVERSNVPPTRKPVISPPAVREVPLVRELARPDEPTENPSTVQPPEPYGTSRQNSLTERLKSFFRAWFS